MIKITESAVRAIKETIEADADATESSFLRVSVQGGGCSGMTYNLAFEPSQKDGDTVVEKDGVRIIVDPKSKIFLVGMTLDYSSGLNGKGFVFSNPNATGTCGCGESFTA
jgi:iron-sulfur cluster assembly protein